MQNQPQATKKPNPVVWVVIAVIAIIAVATGYYFLSQDSNSNTNTTANENSNTNIASNTNNVVLNTNTATAHDELLYTNDEYGFQLEFPEDWKGYTTEIWDGFYVSQDNPTDHVFVTFRHPLVMSSDGLPGEVSFKIAITSNSEVELFPYFTLLETSEEGTRYSYRVGSGAAPGDLSQYSEQIPNIISTFRLI